MPRKSRFDLISPPTGATPPRSALSPVTKLATGELSVFNHAVLHGKHLMPSDAPMLTAYAIAMARCLRSKVTDPKDVSSVIRLARQLRLTSMSTTDPRTAYRRKAAAQPGALEKYLAEVDDYDDDNS